MHTAICAFDDKSRARDAVDTLVRAGFPRHDLHIEHKHARAEGGDANDRWDGMEREVAMDPGRLASLGNFFASLFGRDRHAGHADTYARHVERGAYVVVVDSQDPAEVERARAMLHDMQAGDLTIVDRREQRPLRDIVGLRGDGTGTAGMVERSREPYEGWSGGGAGNSGGAGRPAASHVVTPTTGPDLRDPDSDRPPGLRYADQDDKPL
ncbi:MAG TPA: hypothetical protein VGD76_02850 [Ramlibacter sp.]